MRPRKFCISNDMQDFLFYKLDLFSSLFLDFLIWNFSWHTPFMASSYIFILMIDASDYNTAISTFAICFNLQFRSFIVVFVFGFDYALQVFDLITDQDL